MASKEIFADSFEDISVEVYKVKNGDAPAYFEVIASIGWDERTAESYVMETWDRRGALKVANEIMDAAQKGLV